MRMKYISITITITSRRVFSSVSLRQAITVSRATPAVCPVTLPNAV